MKSIYLSFCALFFTTTVFSQLEAGDWAQPFKMKDINGVEYRLYDYLADGKSVILDLAAAWCSPCWDQHQTKVLHEIWEQYGPDGTDEVMIFFIESDPGTSHEQLLGIEGPSMGNWVTGTPYPIIEVEDRQLPAAYQLNGYPSLVLICPDLRVSVPQMWSGLANWTVENVMAQVSSCAGVAPPEEDAMVHTFDIYNSDCYEGAVSVDLINGGSNTLTEAELLLKRSGQLIDTYNWSGELAFGQEAPIVFEGLELLPGLNEYTVELANTDLDNTNNSCAVPFFKARESSKSLTIFTQTDGHTEADATRWYILDEAGNVIAESGALLDNEFYQQAVDLEREGCYRFVVDDEGYDGLAGGSIIVSDDANRLIVDLETFYGYVYSQQFQALETVSTDQPTSLSELTVFPNPLSEKAWVQLDLAKAGPLQLEWATLLGEPIGAIEAGQLPAGTHQFELDFSNLPAGLYLLNIHTSEGISSRKLLKK